MSNSVQARADVNEFLQRERAALEQLAGALGREVVNKLDRVLVRALISERGQRAGAAGAGTIAHSAGASGRVVSIKPQL